MTDDALLALAVSVIALVVFLLLILDGLGAI